ncbi:hypothetical protein K469DRAFT_688238 [Zopfia rhizophila CBS 207.26]|uniref:Uncharacterized protein n=1 Tax=Zopfia rhizophila CBS 207.26 TaxID=1314779 RepID=A0A6A6E572_9PEZI|nr:hypothetical protein K469DRAFT_688238 [Zopfia rhizophila CBS 207.26]
MPETLGRLHSFVKEIPWGSVEKSREFFVHAKRCEFGQQHKHCGIISYPTQPITTLYSSSILCIRLLRWSFLFGWKTWLSFAKCIAERFFVPSRLPAASLLQLNGFVPRNMFKAEKTLRKAAESKLAAVEKQLADTEEALRLATADNEIIAVNGSVKSATSVVDRINTGKLYSIEPQGHNIRVIFVEPSGAEELLFQQWSDPLQLDGSILDVRYHPTDQEVIIDEKTSVEIFSHNGSRVLLMSPPKSNAKGGVTLPLGPNPPVQMAFGDVSPADILTLCNGPFDIVRMSKLPERSAYGKAQMGLKVEFASIEACLTARQNIKQNPKFVDWITSYGSDSCADIKSIKVRDYCKQTGTTSSAPKKSFFRFDPQITAILKAHTNTGFSESSSSLFTSPSRAHAAASSGLVADLLTEENGGVSLKSVDDVAGGLENLKVTGKRSL